MHPVSSAAFAGRSILGAVAGENGGVFGSWGVAVRRGVRRDVLEKKTDVTLSHNGGIENMGGIHTSGL